MNTTLEHIDNYVLRTIRDTWHASVLDVVMPWFRMPEFWIPVYVFILVFMVKKYGVKACWWLAFFILTFAICDYSSASILKPYFHRLRPCHVVGITQYTSLIPCGGKYGFPSTHASNHFGMSVFIIYTLAHRYKYVVFTSLLWTLLVVYAQVYVGVHYPIDILGGMLLGSIVGIGMSVLFKNSKQLKI